MIDIIPFISIISSIYISSILKKSHKEAACLNLEALNGCKSYLDGLLVAKFARISPVTGAILNPLPEKPQPTTTLEWFGCLSKI